MKIDKGLIALLLIALLVLFVAGCKAPSDDQTTDGDDTGDQVAEEGTLTGDIIEVDNLNLEISDDELDDIDASLDELNW